MGVDALALPYVALRLQPPERLGSAVSAMLNKAYRLNRNPKVPVAGLQLDREALSVAKQFTRAIRLDSVEGIKHGGRRRPFGRTCHRPDPRRSRHVDGGRAERSS